MAGNPLTDPNWAPQLADTVEHYVGMVRDTATTRVVHVVRGVVFGTIIGLTAVATAVLGIIFGTKLLQRIVNIGGWIDLDSAVWVSYLLMGAILIVAGALLMRKRSAPEEALS